MKKRNIIDSSAFIRYFQKDEGFEIVRAKLIKAGEENNPLILKNVKIRWFRQLTRRALQPGAK